MQSWMCWTIFTSIMFVSFNMHSTKPSCRDGFVPISGVGAGWYCTPGYIPRDVWWPLETQKVPITQSALARHYPAGTPVERN